MSMQEVRDNRSIAKAYRVEENLRTVAELYNTEQELSANVVLVSTIICVVTLPVLTIILDKTI